MAAFASQGKSTRRAKALRSARRGPGNYSASISGACPAASRKRTRSAVASAAVMVFTSGWQFTGPPAITALSRTTVTPPALSLLTATGVPTPGLTPGGDISRHELTNAERQTGLGEQAASVRVPLWVPPD